MRLDIYILIAQGFWITCCMFASDHQKIPCIPHSNCTSWLNFFGPDYYLSGLSLHLSSLLCIILSAHYVYVSLCLTVSACLWYFRKEQDALSLFLCPGSTILLFMSRFIALFWHLSVRVDCSCPPPSISSFLLYFADSPQIIIHHVLDYKKQDKMSWRGKPIYLYQLPLRFILIFHLIPFHHDHPLLRIIKVASSISSFYPMGEQRYYVWLRFSNEWILLTTPHPHFSALLSFSLDRLAIAASTKEEAERLLGKEKWQGEIVR